MLPPELKSIVFDYVASMEEYERRSKVLRELQYEYFFRRIHSVYTSLMLVWDGISLALL